MCSDWLWSLQSLNPMILKSISTNIWSKLANYKISCTVVELLLDGIYFKIFSFAEQLTFATGVFQILYPRATSDIPSARRCYIRSQWTASGFRRWQTNWTTSRWCYWIATRRKREERVAEVYLYKEKVQTSTATVKQLLLNYTTTIFLTVQCILHDTSWGVFSSLCQSSTASFNTLPFMILTSHKA